MEGSTNGAVPNSADPRSKPVCGSRPNGNAKGNDEPRRLPSAPRYNSSRGFEGNIARTRGTASAVSATRGELAVECLSSRWKPAKKKVLFLRTGPPAVNP